jgi:hypothetical protein
MSVEGDEAGMEARLFGIYCILLVSVEYFIPLVIISICYFRMGVSPNPPTLQDDPNMYSLNTIYLHSPMKVASTLKYLVVWLVMHSSTSG